MTQYGVYRFNAGSNPTDSVSVQLGSGTTQIFVGLADFAAGRWQLSGPYPGSKTLVIDDGKYISPLHNVWVAVLVAPGQSARVESISVRTVNPDNLPPTAALTADRTSGMVPLVVHFDASGSSDPDGSIVEYAWDCDGDGAYEATSDGPQLVHEYDTPGLRTVRVRVIDSGNARATAMLEVNALSGASAPQAVLAPGPGEVVAYAPYPVAFDASGSQPGDPAGSIIRYDWDWDGDGAYDASSTSPWATHMFFDAPGPFIISVRITDSAGNQAVGQTWIRIDTYPGQALDYQGWVGAGASMTLINGCPAVSYLDDDHSALKFIRALDAGGVTWDEPRMVAVAPAVNVPVEGTTSLCAVDGVPAVAYSRPADGGQLYYVQAQDATGQTWGSPVAIGPPTQICHMPQLLETPDGPAIAYVLQAPNGAGSSYALQYVRALDPEGATWGVPVTPDAGSSDQRYFSAAVVAGNPALAYRGGQTGEYDLGYCSAADSDGASWNAPQVLASASSLGAMALAVVDGQPAIAYTGTAPSGAYSGLLFVRALDTSGDNWGQPVLAASDGAYQLSLAEVTQSAEPAQPMVPAIAYENADQRISYISAEDPDGTTWPVHPTLVDCLHPSGYANLIEADGIPAIAYMGDRRDFRDLMFIRAYTFN
jgi:hypothetical protein